VDEDSLLVYVIHTTDLCEWYTVSTNKPTSKHAVNFCELDE